MIEQPVQPLQSSPPVNRKARISLILAIITLVFVCAGLLPIPGTMLICYPLAFFLSIGAMIYGAIAVREIPVTGESGKGMAQTGIVFGGLTLGAIFCFGMVTVALYDVIQNFVNQTVK